jgi:hypothetical protein
MMRRAKWKYAIYGTFQLDARQSMNRFIVSGKGMLCLNISADQNVAAAVFLIQKIMRLNPGRRFTVDPSAASEFA